MPAFGIGINPNKRDNGDIKGNVYPIACKSWFAPGKAPQPTMFKFKDLEGVIQTVPDLKIKSSEDKYYEGILVNEYRCESVIGGIRYGFKLVFYPLDSKWIMVI